VLFELAMLRMQMQGSGKDAKCVYIAPTKVSIVSVLAVCYFYSRASNRQALCTEKFTEWSAKFEPLGMKCFFHSFLLPIHRLTFPIRL
jgi:ATP-dependent DNA helicase HFM1/MER3